MRRFEVKLATVTGGAAAAFMLSGHVPFEG